MKFIDIFNPDYGGKMCERNEASCASTTLEI